MPYSLHEALFVSSDNNTDESAEAAQIAVFVPPPSTPM
jgi:hypothetical protein